MGRAYVRSIKVRNNSQYRLFFVRKPDPHLPAFHYFTEWEHESLCVPAIQRDVLYVDVLLYIICLGKDHKTPAPVIIPVKFYRHLPEQRTADAEFRIGSRKTLHIEKTDG